MLYVITGGSGSGKSAYAERLMQESGALHKYYLATMQPWGKEAEQRIAKHKKMREGKGFVTVEVYHHLEELSLEAGEEERNVPARAEERAVLLECMSNLAANEQFQVGGSDEEIVGRIIRGIGHLKACARVVIVVTNEVFSDGQDYEEETLRYIKLLGQVNRRLAAMADRVTEVVYGIAVEVKG